MSVNSLTPLNAIGFTGFYFEVSEKKRLKRKARFSGLYQ